jgi:hypothetical protein
VCVCVCVMDMLSEENGCRERIDDSSKNERSSERIDDVLPKGLTSLDDSIYKEEGELMRMIRRP